MPSFRPTFGTAIPAAIKLPKDNDGKQKQTEEEKCQEKGGTWDRQTQTCILFKKEQAPQQPEVPSAAGDKFGQANPKHKDISFNKDGTVTVTKNGKPVTLTKEQYRDSIRVEKGEGTSFNPDVQQAAQSGEAIEAENRGKRLQQLNEMAEQGLLSEAGLAELQQADIDYGQAFTAGTVGSLPSILGATTGGATAGATAGAGIGALIGGIPTLGVGAAPGAAIGAAIGGAAGGVLGFAGSIYSGVKSNIKSQQKGEINAAVQVLTAAKTNMRIIRMTAEQDPNRAEQALEDYYDQLQQVQIAYRQIQLETKGNLNSYMEDGTDILSKFELFLAPRGYADLQKDRLDQALFRGTPATPEEMLVLLEEQRQEDALNE